MSKKNQNGISEAETITVSKDNIKLNLNFKYQNKSINKWKSKINFSLVKKEVAKILYVTTNILQTNRVRIEMQPSTSSLLWFWG